jgi:magnesium chelatase family protein
MSICRMATQECPCGHFGSPLHSCSCTIPDVQRYRSRISGPLLDRIDIHVEVPAIPYRELAGRSTGEASESVRRRVMAARRLQTERFRGRPGVHCNAHMTPRDIRKYGVVGREGDALLGRAITRLGLSARAYDRILKVSRTIADLEGADSIRPEHLSEAIQYRSLDRDFTSMI